ncbi:hypothetical protein ACGFMM_01310 [Streptomyces sp. NPDC048604]|uniref:hypothetical protein n=1 Tax=Streptomyces sp. NPDC048604 TaxID=3365578 RepID=UPI003715AAA9
MPDFADTKVSLAGQGALVGKAITAPSGGAFLARVAGIDVTTRVMNGVSISVGNMVLMARMGSVYWAIGTTPAAPVVAPTPPDPGGDDDVSGDPAPAPKPTVTTGTLLCAPVATATYRSGWRSDGDPLNSFDTYQGRYSGSNFGRMTGCAFYGTKPRSLAGATVTRATVKLRRLSSGDFAARTATLRLVTQATRPAGAPTLNETTSGPSLAVGATTTGFVIPNSWAQAMVDGTRGGLAIHVDSDTPYIRLAGRGSWSAAWALTISWRRG